MNREKNELLQEELKFRDDLNNQFKQKETPDKSSYVKDIIFVGDVKWNDKVNGNELSEKLYIVRINKVTRDENGELQVDTINNYYLGDKCIGGYIDDKDPQFYKVFEYSEPDKVAQIKNLLENTPDRQLEEQSMSKLLEERKQEIAKVLGINPDEIENIDEIDLDTKIPNLDKEDRSEKGEELENKDRDEDDSQRISESQTEKLNVKEETKLGQFIQGESLGQKLGLEKIGITDGVKLARVSTSSLASQKDIDIDKNAIDTFVVIRANGEAVVLGEDILRLNTREGTNPTQRNLTVDNDEGKVDKEVNTTSYEIVNGNGREFLNVGYDEFTGREIKYSTYSDQYGQYVDFELETQKTWMQDSDVREFMNDRPDRYQADHMLEKNAEHGKCEEKDITVIDNDKDNDDHPSHDKFDMQYCIDTILENEEIAEIYNSRNVQKEILKKINEDKNKKYTNDMVIEEVSAELEEKAKYEIERASHNIDGGIA